MTTELEQKFYDTFGIEPKNKCGKALIYPNCLNPNKCGYDNCIYYQMEYPEITAEKLLEIICILNDYEGINVKAITVGGLKEELLSQCIEYFSYPISFEENADLCKLHSQIQQLFKGISE